MTDELQFLYMIRPTRLEMLTEGPTNEEERIISEHFQYLKDLTEQGVLILAGRTQNTDSSSFGIVIFKAPSEAAAITVVDDDPAVSQGVMSAELFPYRVALITEMKDI